jgi:hypothetical protein
MLGNAYSNRDLHNELLAVNAFEADTWVNQRLGFGEVPNGRADLPRERFPTFSARSKKF